MYQIPYIRKFKKTIKCPRCTKIFEEKIGKCPHCENIKDGHDLTQFIEKHQMEMLGGAELGKIFVIIAAIIGCLLLLAQL